MILDSTQRINALSGWARTGVNAGVNIAIVPILLVSLGIDGFAMLSVVMSAAGVFQFLDFGILQSLERMCSKYYAESDTVSERRGLEKAFAYIVWMSVIVFIGAALAMALVLFYWAAYFDKILVLVVYGFFVVIANAFSLILASVVRSRNYFFYDNLIGAGALAGKFVLVFACFKFGILKLSVFLMIDSLMMAARIGALIVPAVRALKYNPFSLFIGGDGGGVVGKFSSKFERDLWVVKIANYLKTNSDALILSRFGALEQLALYRPVFSMMNAMRPFVNVLSEQMVPKMTKTIYSGNSNDWFKLYIVNLRITISMAACVLVYFFLSAQQILGFWLGDSLSSDNIETMVVLLRIAVIIEFMHYFGSPVYVYLLSKGDLKFVAWKTELPLAIANFLASIVLVKHYSMGALGVVLPTLVTTCIYVPVNYLYFSNKTKISHVLVAKAISPSLFYVIVAWLISACLESGVTKYEFVVGSLVYGVISGLFFLWILKGSRERV